MNTTLAKIPSMKLTAPRIINPVDKLLLIEKMFVSVKIFANIPPPIKKNPNNPNAKIGL